MGVVIGATAQIGDDVMLYHGVTLGGRSTSGEEEASDPRGRCRRRHGATILGPVTIGSHSVVGAQAVVVTDAPPYSVLTGIPAVARPRSTGSTDYEWTDPGIYI